MAGEAFEPDPEAPRFVRGFHDILITIGVVLGLGGLTALLGATLGDWLITMVLTAVAAWGLSEHLVRRLRLALPAVALSIAFVVTSGMAVAAALSATVKHIAFSDSEQVYVFLAGAIAAALFFFRFRVPFSLGLLFAAAGGVIVAGYLEITGKPFLDRGGEFLLLGLSLIVFAVALRLDFSDPMRQTRRSDYAFWLHLLAAPLLLGSVMTFLVGISSVFELSGTLNFFDAVIVVATMTALAILAILIDRRAFLVAGLGYLGAAIFSIAANTPLADSVTGAVTVMALGAIILVLALGWQRVRATLLAIVPDSLRAKLPPVHRPAVARLAA
ncbi:MAG: hypothetical protein C0606_07405 [Hyphomicrobiales bacterium]|nr:MAG: hypothetical protein C0606_07405 [Hyphomicrobiales bacterium]